jgi:diguanylate cyclase
LPEAFADLEDQAELSQEFSTNLDRMQSDMSVFVMAIRNHNTADESSISSLLPVVRSTLRTVDRIGYANSSTLLVCMPSVSEEVAFERGTQICRSAATIGMATGSDCKRPVTIGIAKANGDEKFDLAVRRAIGLADEGLDEENDAVCTESQQVSAV